MINAVGGKYEDVVCFVPVRTLDWQILLAHFKKVILALFNIGFKTNLVITDGHRTNVRFFTEVSGGELRVKIPHPVSQADSLFLLFDPIYLLKNFYNNFQRKRLSMLYIPGSFTKSSSVTELDSCFSLEPL